MEVEDTITLPNEINRLCRTCMTLAVDNNQFIENTLFDEAGLTCLGSMLEDLTASTISSDNYPGVLCDICVENLKQAFFFKKQCEESIRNLKELLFLFENNQLSNSEENALEASVKAESDNLPVEILDDDNNDYDDGDNERESETTIWVGFNALYDLSRDMIRHDKSKSLSERFHENSPDDFIDNLISDIIFSPEMLNMVEVRKNESSLLNDIFEVKFSDNPNILVIKEEEDQSTNESQQQSSPKRVIRPSGNNSDIITPKKKPLTYYCKHCYHSFANRSKYKFHSCSEKDNQQFVEIKSEKDFNLPVNCNICNKMFQSDALLSIHFIYHVVLEERVKRPELLLDWIFCDVCGQVFDSEEKLLVHKDSHPKQYDNYLCEKCGNSFERDIDLILHDDIDHEENESNNPLTCPICKTTFENKSVLLAHGIHHLLKKVNCRECRQTYCTQETLNEHMVIHPRYSHVCKLCGKRLSSASALKCHISGIHNQEALHMCTICGKCFKTSNRLRIHRDIHSSYKKHMCAICGYRTHKGGDLNLHMRIHTSEHPYKCTYANCDKVFKTSSHFNQHIRHHLDIKQYQCQICLRSFSHSYSLKLHKMRHTGEKPHPCVVCSARFRRKDHLRVHMKQHHK